MKFRQAAHFESMGIQLAPMLDIVFLLLMFFLVTWNLARFETEIDISVPAAEEGQQPNRTHNEVILNVHTDGRVVLNSEVATDEALLARFKALTNLNPNVAVIVRGDKATPYEHIVHVLDVCKKGGVWNVSFMTARPTPQNP